MERGAMNWSLTTNDKQVKLRIFLDSLSPAMAARISRSNPYRLQRNDLLKLLYSAGVTQAALAAASGLSLVQVQRLCAGARKRLRGRYLIPTFLKKAEAQQGLMFRG